MTDGRSKKEILEILKKRAASYTPEWNLDLSQPDIAAALTMACAEMLEGTSKKIGALPLKNEIAFFNLLNASLLPAVRSEGYVSFSLSTDDAPPVEVPKGTVLTSYAADGDPIHFETADDVLVSAAKIKKCFCVDDASDHIGLCDDLTKSCTSLFRLPKENLQSHTLTLTHPYGFHIDTHGELRLGFFHQGGIPVISSTIKALTDRQAVRIEYYHPKNGFVPFRDVQERGGELVLIKNDKMPAILPEENACTLRMTVSDILALRELRFDHVTVKPSGRQIPPDSLTDGSTELEINSFFPFGERFQLFNEIYIGCGEVLDKRGATVTLSFDVRFQQVPIENQLGDDEIKWKWIANKNDFKERPSYLITITEVIWEYYNGSGWSRLFPDRRYSDIFHCQDGVTSCFRSMSFVCPEDISEVFAGAKEDYYIRARILKADNLYKLKGFYLSPMLRSLSFDYHYEDSGCLVEEMTARNCLEERRYAERDEKEGQEFVPFYGTGDSHRTVYLGFSSAPENGPISLLWDTAEDPLAVRLKLNWEYCSRSGWKRLNMVDETEGFTTVGLTILLDNHGFLRRKLFGEELFWIRISDAADSCRRGTAACPMIRRVSMNAVRAKNVDSHREDRFAMDVYAENRVFRLSSAGVLDIDVYVNEYPTLTGEEAKRLTKENKLIRVTNDAGIITELWVKWDEVSTFIMEDARSRVYTADRSKGTITFGSGRKGRIPSASDTDNIRVFYTTGGGARTNVPAEAVSGMERPIGFVSGVRNPRSFYGGRDTETVFEALKRSAVLLRTQGKAITVRDFEDLAFCASSCIEKVRCVSGYNRAGEAEHGAVTLVVLKSENCDFSRLQSEIKAYLLPRIDGALAAEGRFYLTEPTMIRLDVKAEIAVRSLDGIFELKRNAESSLRTFIGSYAGKKGSREWMLGRIPNEQQIRSALLRISNVEFIRSINITTYVSSADGLREADADGIRTLPYILPECGDTDISIVLA